MCEHGTSVTLLLPTPDPTDPDGLRFKHRLWPVDACIAGIIQALNASGVATIGSCCGHGKGHGTIALADGRWLIITTREAALGANLPWAEAITWDERRSSSLEGCKP